MTFWESDTCYCIIEFFDDTIQIKKIIRNCNMHSDNIGDNFIASQARTLNETFGLVAQGIIRPLELDEDFENIPKALQEISKYLRLMKENPTRTDISNEIKMRNDKIIDFFEKLDKNIQDRQTAKEISRNLP